MALNVFARGPIYPKQFLISYSQVWYRQWMDGSLGGYAFINHININVYILSIHSYIFIICWDYRRYVHVEVVTAFTFSWVLIVWQTNRADNSDGASCISHCPKLSNIMHLQITPLYYKCVTRSDMSYHIYISTRVFSERSKISNYPWSINAALFSGLVFFITYLY